MIPLILGMIMNVAAEKHAAERREKLANAMRSYQLGQSQIGQGAIEGLIQQQTPAARGAELDKLTADRANSLRTTVGSVQSSNPSPINAKPSADYAASQERATGTVAERTRRAIEQLSAMGAPGERALAHGLRYGRAAGTVDATNSAIANVGNAYASGINNTVANPSMKLAGGALMAYGSGGATAGGESGDPEQLSGPGYDEQPTTAARMRRAMSLFGRRSA